MKILGRIKSLIKNDSSISLSDINSLFFGSAGSSQYGADLTEITYFTCLKTLSENLGKMPVYLIDTHKNRILNHDTTRVLSIEPNNVMTPIQFFTRLEYCRNHFGNGYAYISRINGKLNGLYVLDPRCVQIWVNNTSAFSHRLYYYQYTDTRDGKTYWINPEDMIHVKSWITDDSGYAGKSVREILASSMTGNKAAQKFLNDLYAHGLTANAVVKYVGDLSRKEQTVLLKNIENQARDESRRMITLPIGFDLQTLDLKLTDSQFYELRKYNALQIAAAFGVNPDHLNDYSKSSYNNSAMQNLQFYVNTLLYNVTLYEQEMNRKLLTTAEQKRGLGFKFNVWVLLRGAPSQQANIMQKLVTTAIYSPNEARDKLDMPPCENGDIHMVNGSYVPLEDIGKAYEKNGGVSDAENQESSG